MAALVAALIDAADRWSAVRRLELGVRTDDARAIALYSRLGFEDEGVARDDAVRDGRSGDVPHMARIRRVG